MPVLILLVVILLLLGGCPGEPGNQQRPGDSQTNAEQEISRKVDQHVQPAVDFIRASLKDPAAEGNATLEDCWNIITRLDDPSPFRNEISLQVSRAGGQPGFELLSAWLSTHPAEASDFLKQQAASGNTALMQALVNHPELGRRILLDLDITNQSVDFQDAALLLIRNWGEPFDELLPVFRQLAESEDPEISLRAKAYLLRLDEASDEQLEELREAIKHDKDSFMAAMEAGKISQSEKLATAFIPRVKDVVMGEPDPELKWDMQPYFSAYALAYIPGREAEVIRRNLLEASNLDLRWQARFGELMQGDPASFTEAMLSEGVLSPYVMKCLAPPEAVHPDLLNWYARAIEQAGEAQRFQLAAQLSRYNEHASDPQLRKLVEGLLEDDSSLVQGQAWLLAAEFGYTGHRVEAAGLLASETAQASLKAAAACYLLSVPAGS